MNKFKLSLLLIFFVTVSACRKGTLLEKNVSPNDFLSSKNYDNLVVEIQCVNGFVPTEQTQNNIKAFMNSRLNKPRGISVVLTNITSSKTSYNLDEIKALEKDHRSQKTTRNTLTAYFLFVDADYAANSGNSKILGIAYGNSSMVIFEKTIRDNSGGIGLPSTATLETTVACHEMGHILGLVNNGSSMVSNHQEQGHHCNNTNCLMYYNVETTDVIANLLNGVPTLDNKCIEDLQANGGK